MHIRTSVRIMLWFSILEPEASMYFHLKSFAWKYKNGFVVIQGNVVVILRYDLDRFDLFQIKILYRYQPSNLLA